MSYSTIYRIVPGVEATALAQYRNGWGAAPVVWDVMCRKLLNKEFSSLMMREPGKIWELFNDKEVQIALRAVLGMTFDNVYIERQHFERAARNIRLFLAWAKVPEDRVNHWPLFAAQLESNKDNENCPAIGFQHTSVSDNYWTRRHDEEGNEQPIEWEKTWSLYSELDSQMSPHDGTHT